MPTPDTDVVAQARELLILLTPEIRSRIRKCLDHFPEGVEFTFAPELIAALVKEVEHARRALKGMTELWDAECPDDPCGCVGASDDCKHPPPCELCVARLVAEGRTKELFEG